MNDPVNHPSHYTQFPREVIELTEQLDFCVGNAVKYILRAPFKGATVQDYEKAKWYIRRAAQKYTRVPPEAEKIAKDFNDKLVVDLLSCFSDTVPLIAGLSSVSHILRAVDERIASHGH